jgi:transcription factor 1
MSFILADWVWRVAIAFFFRRFSPPSHTFQRISAPPKGVDRCKLSVTAEASSQFFLSLPPEQLSPFLDHFHPAATTAFGTSSLRPDNRRRGSPFLAVNVVPHAEQVCHVPSLTALLLTLLDSLGIQVIDKGKMDQWDYILRRLFVLKSRPLRSAISSLAPGAEVLLKVLTDKNLPPTQRVDIRIMVKHLTLSDWALIARAFDAWPFAPEVCRFTIVPSHKLIFVGPS